MLTPQQEKLRSRAEAIIKHRVDTGDYLPCFGLTLSASGEIDEILLPHRAGLEKDTFVQIVDKLHSAISAGAVATALMILAELPIDGATTGATIDLEQKGMQRVIGFLQYSSSQSGVEFQEAQFVAKPAVLFRAP